MSRVAVSSLFGSCIAGLFLVLLCAGCGVDRGGGGEDPGFIPDGGFHDLAQGNCKCPAGQICCGNKCVDPKKDFMNCGACGRGCGTGENCNNGNCGCASGPKCPTGQMCCGTDGCVNLMTDAKHCGACTTNCDPDGMGGETCMAGKCGCGMADKHCNTMGGELCCDGSCTDTQSNVMACGLCGNTCAMGQTCDKGNCAGGNMGMMCGMATCKPGEMCLMGICIPGGGGGGNCMSDADCKMGMKCTILGILPCMKGLPFPCMCG